MSLSSANPIGFVLLTHARPEQMLRLVRRLNSMFSDPPIVCHHDFGKCPLPEGFLPPNVEFVRPHVDTQWGEFSLVEAVILALTQMYRRPDAPDWCVTLSGACYPTKPAAQILENIYAGGYDAHFEVKDLDPKNLPTKLHKEYYKRYCIKKVRFPSVDRRGRPLLRRLNLLHIIGRYWVPFGEGRLRCYAGSQWFTVGRRAAEYIIGFQKTPLAAVLEKHYRTIIYSDESYFQTVVCNAPDLKVHHDNLVYLDWSGNHAHPKLLLMEDLEAITASHTHFARKMDMERSADLLDALDRIIDSSSPRQTDSSTGTKAQAVANS